MKYRSEIDGLRAIAVIPVVLFHAGFSLFNGGFIGVDIFFVISGYLITTILIEKIENNQFSILNFYERRARRILPALFLVMLVSFPLSWMWMLQDQFEQFSQSLVAVSLFISNILFWSESGYFDLSAELKPLLHTWSLAVEEQYYLLFPPFLYFAWRLGKNRVFLMIVIMSIISFILSEWGWRNKPSANFYLAPTRVWELFSGSIAAFIAMKNGVQKNNFLSFIGLILIIGSIFIFDELTPFPSYYALAPVLGVMLIILFARSETFVASLLSNKIIVQIGLISYSTYLWHQPIFAFARIRMIDEPTKIFMLFLSFASLFIGFISWKYVEKIFRDDKILNRKQIFKFSIYGFMFFIFLGTLGFLKSEELKPGNFNPIHRLHDIQIGNYVANNKLLQQESWKILRDLSKDDEYSAQNNEYDNKLWYDLNLSNKGIIIVGNSHSKDMYNILSQNETFTTNYQIARYGLQIRDLNDGHKFWNSPNYINSSYVFIATRYNELDTANLSYVIKKVKNDGKKIFLFNNIFEFPGEASGYSLIDKVVLRNNDKNSYQISENINKEYYNYFVSNSSNRSEEINKILKNISIENNVILLDRMDYICDSESEKCFAVDEKITKNFYDYGHHTLEGSKKFAKSTTIIKYYNLIRSE